MENDDQAFLSQIEQNIREKGNEQVDAKKEAEQRALEMERIRAASKNLPGASGTATPKSGVPSQAGSAPPKANPLENDPRYKEYFQRLRRQRGEAPADQKQTPPGGTDTQPAGPAAARAASQTIGPGSIVRFDDGSIGIYKDAVSGKDYALFYFLNPDGQLQPEGVFLQCYQARVLGSLPENHFARIRDEGTWSRDLILYHLAQFDYVENLDNLSEHEERKPRGGTPARNPSVQSSTPPPAEPTERADEKPATATATTPSEPTETPAPPPAETPREPGLEKGRRFQIKFGGKQWEAVYWASEDENSIVAHSTHGNWSLMRLDLSRFKDSLELLDKVDDETMEAIAKEAAAES